ncbi:glycosyl transferase, group 1 family protein [Rhodopirellula sallentina SM41]|uniref:Glycosyl transferase, group 1 family protein n=2 Tax=Rhodopirellula TaxID=265488 RepID=M5U4T5_9BACT|nr:glycosyl transferase, group 1 family protein [Rhodopirellula sallentina SM41]
MTDLHRTQHGNSPHSGPTFTASAGRAPNPLDDTMQPKPRVLFVDQTGQLGGAELCLYDLVARRNGDDRVVLFQDGPFRELLVEGGVATEVLPISSRAATLRKDSGVAQKLSAVRGMASLIQRVASRAREYDAIYANTPKAFIVSAIAGKIARRPTIYHLHDILSTDHFSGSNLRLLTTFANRLSKHVIANSEATAAAFADAGGDSRKVTIVHNGFDITQFEVGDSQARDTRGKLVASLNKENEINETEYNKNSSLPITGNTPLVAVFGRLSPWKGQHIAIEAIAKTPTAHLLLVGDAMFGESEYVEQLHIAAERPETKGRVHFLGFRDEIATLMRAVDIVVHCSTAPEPFGRVVVEGLLSKTPVIAANAGGAAEIVLHEQTGLLTTPGDSEALARSITRLLSDPELARSFADAGYQDAAKRFRIEDRLRETDLIIENTARRLSVA